MAADSRVTGFIHQATKPFFEPLLTGPLLYVLLKGPEQAREPILKTIAALPFTVERVTSVVKWLFVLGVVGRVNQALNKWAINQWRFSSQRSKYQWNKEVIVVTGGSSGIGKAITQRLLKEGAKVAVVDIQPLPADLDHNNNVRFFKCDITSADAVRETGDAIRKSFGQSPSVLVNNAGIGSSRSIIEHDDRFLRKIMNVNLISHFTTVKEFMPDMLTANKGQIVTIASMASFVSVPGIADYAATKAGVLAFHEALNQELKHYHKVDGIATTVVHPNWVSTPLVQSFEKEIKSTNGPLLKAEDVGRKIAEHILSATGGQLIFPEQMSRVTGIRGWPNWLQEALRDLIGKGSAPAMGHWKGVQARQ